MILNNQRLNKLSTYYGRTEINLTGNVSFNNLYVQKTRQIKQSESTYTVTC